MVFTGEAEIFTERIALWAHYINDVFLLWHGDAFSFQEFVDWLNINPIGLKFICESNEFSLPFLDVLISKGNLNSFPTVCYVGIAVT